MKQVLFVFVLLLIVSCRTSKVKLFKAGDVRQPEFFKVVSFETKGSLPIVTVVINGIEAKCLFDTGAPNVISPELAEKLNLKTVNSSKVRDSGGNKERQKYVVLDSVDMDGIVFRNIAAIVVDLEANDAIRCLDIDGIIGANQMRQAYWEMNAQQKSLTLTNDISKLTDTSGMDVLNFTTAITGTPKVDIKLNGHLVKNMTFDTGSNGHLVVPKREIKEVPFFKENKKVLSEVGSTSFGIYGLAPSDTSFYRIVDSIAVGDGLFLESATMEFRGSAKLIGMKLFENYTVIMDWNSNHIYMKELKKYQKDEVNSYGFSFIFSEKSLFVGSVILETEAARVLQVGDQILSMNEDDYAHIDDEFYCPLHFDKAKFASYGEILIMKIKRGEEIFDVELVKSVLLD